MRRLGVGLCGVVAAGAVLASSGGGAAGAAGSGTQLVGTIGWTTTVTADDDVPGGDRLTSKEVRTVALKIRMTRRKGAFGWQPQDDGSSYTGRYTLDSTRVARDPDGSPSCTTTHAASATASGKLPRRPRSTTPPVLLGSVVPATATLGPRTKGLVLTPILRYRGSDTVTDTPMGIAPCQGGTLTDPVEGSLAPVDDARQVCYPAGTSKALTTPQAGQVVGAWRRATRTFVFTCSRTVKDENGRTVAVKVSGALKLR